MSEEKPLSKAYLAEATGVTKAALSQGRFRTMPDFYRLEDFIAWKDATARRKSKPKITKPEVSEGFKPLPPIDVTKFEVSSEDFDEEAVRRAERVANWAQAVVEAALDSNNLYILSAAIKEWAAVQKEVIQIRTRWLELEEKSSRLLDLDVVIETTLPVLQALRNGLDLLASRIAAEANPENPELAAAAIRKGVDNIYGEIEAAENALGATAA